MSRGGRFGKYGELKRKSRLRAARLAKRKRFGANASLAGEGRKTASSRQRAAGKVRK